MTSMTSCIVGKKIWAMGPGPLEIFPFVVLAILMAMAGGISEHMLTSWSSSKSTDRMAHLDARPTGDQEVMGSTPAEVSNMRGD